MKAELVGGSRDGAEVDTGYGGDLIRIPKLTTKGLVYECYYFSGKKDNILIYRYGYRRKEKV